MRKSRAASMCEENVSAHANRQAETQTHTKKTPIYSHIQPCSGHHSFQSILKQSGYPYQELPNAIHCDRRHLEMTIYR